MKRKKEQKMEDRKWVYPWSLAQARRLHEKDAWIESYKENCICARAIELALRNGYKDNRLNETCAKEVIGEYGYDRVNWVLANTVQENIHDGRYSAENKAWARGFFIPKEPEFQNSTFAVNAHPVLIDGFVNQARQEWQKLGLFDKSQCYPEKMDYTNKVVVLRPEILKDEYKNPKDQLFYAQGGNGCRPQARGQKVFGRPLNGDESETYYCRSDILGVLKLELVPDWAQEKLAEWTSVKEQAEAPEAPGMGEQT